MISSSLMKVSLISLLFHALFYFHHLIVELVQNNDLYTPVLCTIRVCRMRNERPVHGVGYHGHSLWINAHILSQELSHIGSAGCSELPVRSFSMQRQYRPSGQLPGLQDPVFFAKALPFGRTVHLPSFSENLLARTHPFRGFQFRHTGVEAHCFSCRAGSAFPSFVDFVCLVRSVVTGALRRVRYSVNGPLPITPPALHFPV